MRDITSDRFALVKMSLIFFAKAVSIFIKNRTVRQNIHRQNIILNRHRIIKVPLAFKKLTQLFHHIVGDFTPGRFNGWIHNWHQVFVVPRGNASFANRIKENTKS
jgi:hypothetical protein